MTTKKGLRFTEVERTRILAAAAREGLSGLKAAKRFGISTLTFYTWRKRAGRSSGAGMAAVESALASVVLTGVRAKVAAVIPGIVNEEVTTYLDQAFGRMRRT